MKRPSKPFLGAVALLVAVAAGIVLVDVQPSRVYASGHDLIFGAPPAAMPTCHHKASCPDAAVAPAHLSPVAAPGVAAFDADLDGLDTLDDRAGVASGVVIRGDWAGVAVGR